MSRQNQIPSCTSDGPSHMDTASSTLALIPVWDMANHKDGPSTTGYDVDKDELQMFADQAVQAGEPFFMFVIRVWCCRP